MSRSSEKHRQWDIALLLATDGFTGEMVRTIAKAVMDRGGTSDHLKRIVQEPELVGKIVDLLFARRSLGEGEYEVRVAYEWNRREVEAFFSGGVSDLFLNVRYWKIHPSFENANRKPGTRIFLLKEFAPGTEVRSGIEPMLKLGYRPASLLEGYAFAKALPSIQLRYNIFVPGSSTVVRNDEYCPLLTCGADKGRQLVCGLLNRKLISDELVLFVRDESLLAAS